jgi:prevent-host-death family protein
VDTLLSARFAVAPTLKTQKKYVNYVELIGGLTMRTFSSQDLQQQSGEIQRAAVSGPVVIMNHGKPRSVVMSVDEFRRLKEKAGEGVPQELDRPRPTVRRVPMRDPLGYSTSDLRTLAVTMADAAISGRNREAVRAEIEAVERRLGLQ